MTAIPSILRGAADLLACRHLPWALVGGWAVSARTEPRFTRDVDLAVAVGSDELAQAATLDFRASGYLLHALVEQDAAGRLATVRLQPPGASPAVLLDLLFASSGIEAEVCREAEPLELLPRLVVPVARPHHLLALKILSRDDRTRPQDAADIRALLATMDAPMCCATATALDLISARGFHRGRDLRRLLEDAQSEFRG